MSVHLTAEESKVLYALCNFENLSIKDKLHISIQNAMDTVVEILKNQNLYNYNTNRDIRGITMNFIEHGMIKYKNGVWKQTSLEELANNNKINNNQNYAYNIKY